MKIIKDLNEMIEKELDGAEEYIHCAIKWKDENPALARALYQVSETEMENVNMLHEQVVRLIDEYSKAGNVVPPDMKAVYDYLHERNVKRATEVKAAQALFKEK